MWSTNLYGLKIENGKFSVYEPVPHIAPEDVSLINRVLFRASHSTGKPSFFRNGKIYILEAEQEQILIKLDDINLILKKVAEEITSPRNITEVGQYIRKIVLDFENYIRGDKKLKASRLKRLKTCFLVKEPEIRRNVFEIQGDFYICIDVGYSIVDPKPVKEILEDIRRKEGAEREKEKEKLYHYRYRPSDASNLLLL